MALLIGIPAGLSAWSQPVIEFETRSYDFGTSYPNQQLLHNFLFKNAGTQILNVSQVLTSCGCTAAVLSASGVLPGGTGILSVTATTTGIGKYNQHATLFSNDPVNSQVSVEINALVRNLWTLSPKPIFQFGDVPFDSEQSIQLFLKNVDGDPFKVLGTKVDKPEFTVEVGQPLQQPGLTVPITVKVKAPRVKGPLTSTLEIRTDHPKQPLVESTIFAGIVGYLRFSQERIYFGMMRPGETVKKVIIATPTGPMEGKNVTISGISSDSDVVKGQILGANPDGSFSIEFRFTAPNRVGYQTGVIKIQTNIPAEPISVLNYSALVRNMASS